MYDLDINALRFDGNGLIPAIIQDYKTHKVLTLAYMNRESLEITMEEGHTCFFSRSRQELWRKGETSGNFQTVMGIKTDCDADALLIEVQKAGPACHTGADSCFDGQENRDDTEEQEVDGLYALLCERKALMPEGSYTTYLFEQGIEKILKKIGEESAEVLIAAMKGSRAELIYELTDLLYHSLVLMVNEGINPEDVRGELTSRRVVDTKIKQEPMK